MTDVRTISDLNAEPSCGCLVHHVLVLLEKPKCALPDFGLATSETSRAVEIERGKVPHERISVPDSQENTADMRAIVKKILKLLIKQMPMYQLRSAMLRWCGYAVGKDVYVGEDLIIIDEPSDWGMVSIGDRVAVSPRVTLVVSSRPTFSRMGPYVPVKHGPITIENDVWLGTGVVVLPNITIGEGAVVGANSVVTEDVRPYTIVGGSPARLIREVSVPWIEETEIQVP